MNIKLIRAFIASPGGLEAERRAAFAAADAINKSVAVPMGARLELIGWEETLSGNGRPQAIINAEMETCDLFVGAIWTSWGSRPALTGPYSSGFEEEFELSRTRHANTGTPSMAMFFKTVDPRQLRDPGQDLRKVLDFQERLRSAKTFLYGTFSQPEEFAGKVREFLSVHVIRLLRQHPPPREERASSPPRSTVAAVPAAAEISTDDAPDARFLQEAAKDLGTDRGPGPVDVARLRLIAAAHGKSENDRQLLGVHDANMIYEARKRFELSFLEKYGLLEAGLSRIDDENVPVWTWLADMTQTNRDTLKGLSVFSEPAERIGAITAMRLLGYPIDPPNLLGEGVVDQHWLSPDAPAPIKLAALRYLRDLGTPQHFAAVQREFERASNDTTKPALETAVAILLRRSEADAVRFVLTTSFETIETTILNRVLGNIELAALADLRSGLDHRSPDVRAASLDALSQRGTLDLATLERAQDDDAPIVRYYALRALDRIGQAPSLDEAQKILSKSKPGLGVFGLFRNEDPAGGHLFERYTAERMRSMPQPRLEALLTTAHQVAAYQALAARQLSDFGSRLRSDLGDGFEAYFERHWPDGIKPSAASGALTLLGEPDPAGAKKRELVSQALDIVAAQKDASDLPLVRATLDRGRIYCSSVVLAFLRMAGQEEDIFRLGRTSRINFDRASATAHDRDFVAAAQLILKLHRGSLVALLSRDLPTAMRAKLIDLASAKAFAALDDENIIQLLLSSDDEFRRACARKVPASLPRGRVAKILKAYRQHPEGRYYVVTHWLDLGLAYGRTAVRQVVAAGR